MAVKVPRSYKIDAWETIRRLLPHVKLCWSYITEGRRGLITDLSNSQSSGHLFRHIGKYEDASTVYRMIECGISLQTPTLDNTELLADVHANLGLVYTSQEKFQLALHFFDRSFELVDKHMVLTPDALMSIMYNKAALFIMTDRLDEAEELLRDATTQFSIISPEESVRTHNERNNQFLRIMHDMGEVLLRRGSLSEALKLFRDIDRRQDHQGEPRLVRVSVKLKSF